MPSAKSDKQIPPSQYVANAEPAVRPILQRARRLVRSIAPRAEERAWRGWPIRFATDDGDVVAVMAYPRYASLGFFKGTSLDDPEGLLEGTGKALRHVKLRTVADVDRPAVKRLVKQAFALGGVSFKRNVAPGRAS